MSNKTTLAELILRGYDQSIRDPRGFDWVSLEHLGELLSPLANDGARLTEIGAWIYTVDTKELTELGTAIASYAESSDGDLIKIIAAAQAAEMLGDFSPDILETLREIPVNDPYDYLDDPGFYQEYPWYYEVDRAVDTALSLLVRNGTDTDREFVEELIEEETFELQAIFALHEAGFEISHQFEVLQREHALDPSERNLELFCGLAAENGVEIDWQRLVKAQKLDWIEGILIRILRAPTEFEAQREGLREALNDIQNASPSGPLAIIALRRLGEDTKLLQPFLDESNKWEERVAAHIALIDDLPKEYFTERAREEEDAGLQAVYLFLYHECAPSTPLSDLELVRKITEEQLLQKIFFNDRRLRATRQSYTGLFQTAGAGEELTDAECALLLSAIEGDSYGRHPLGSVVLFAGDSPPIGPGFGYRLFSGILLCGGPETRALLLHRLFMKDNLWDYLNPLLVLIACLDGPRLWIEPILSQFYGLEQSEEEPWLEGEGAILIESLQNAYQYDLESIAMSMTESELLRRPALLSHMWEHPKFLLR